MTKRVFAVVGDPVAHSLSPLIHTRWIEEHGLDGAYVALHLRSKDVAPDIRSLAGAGFSGLNITLPHKLAALEAARVISPEAKLVGAVNTLALQADGTWSGDNTDVEGFALAVSRATSADLTGRKVAVVGAGGAARAALVHLERLGASIVLLNRTPENAAKLVAELAPRAETAGLDGLAKVASDADLVINTASLGHLGEALPGLPAGQGRPLLDLSYGKAAAPVLKAAAEAGWTPHDGLPMLVGQAAAAFRIWWKIDPDQEGALKACRARVAA